MQRTQTVNEKNVDCQKMYGVIKGENRYHSCQYEFVGTLRKRNNSPRQIFLPHLQNMHALATLLSVTPG